MQSDDIIAIVSYLRDGYTSNDIQRIAGYTADDIEEVKSLYMPINSQKIISKELSEELFDEKTINVFCKFLSKGATDNQVYDIFGLHKKCTRKEFHDLCYGLRHGILYNEITSKYKIPKRGNTGYKSPYPIIRSKKRKSVKTKETINNQPSFIKKEEDTIMTVTNVQRGPSVEDILPNFSEPIMTGDIYSKIKIACSYIRANPNVDDISLAEICNLNVSTIRGIKDGILYTEISKRYGIVSHESRRDLNHILKKIEGD